MDPGVPVYYITPQPLYKNTCVLLPSSASLWELQLQGLLGRVGMNLQQYYK